MGEIKSTIAMFPGDFTELVGLLATKSLMFWNKERSLLTCCRDKDSDATWLYGPLIPDSNSGPTSNNLFPCQPKTNLAEAIT
jgi:hypothetical protein